MFYRSVAITLFTSVLFAQSPQSDSRSLPSVTLKANSQLVIVDVTVTDAHRKPVHNLKASDFVVLEDDVSQNVKVFEEHAYVQEPATPIKQPPLPPGVFTNFSPVPVKETLNVLLLDTLNTALKDQAFVRDQIKQYLKTAPSGTRIAVFGLATRLYLLQGFTSNPEILRAAVDGKGSSRSSPLLHDTVGGGNGDVSLSQQYDDNFGNLGLDGTAQVIGELQQFEAEQQSVQLQMRAKYTLDSLNQLARYLSGLQGRKNLIWFSGSFPINILPDGDLKNPFAVVASSEDEFRQTTNLLARSQVAVYPVDARGLVTSPTLNASNSVTSSAVRNPTAFGKDEMKFYDQIAGERSTMLRMAEQTGGRAYINTNDLSQTVSDVTQNGSNYYTIAYSPSNTKWDGRYRKIQVRAAQSGFTLTYRRGYFADDPQGSYRSSRATATLPITSIDPMRAAMMHGAPDPTQIIFQVRVVPSSAGTEEMLAPGTAAGLDLTRMKPPYRRYSVIFAADPTHIRFTQSADGNYAGQIQFVTYVYDRNGQLITRAGNEVHANLPREGYAALFRGGLHFVQQISVPDKGDYFLRIGVHDMDGDHAGAVEFPVAAVRNLPVESGGGTQPGNIKR